MNDVSEVPARVKQLPDSLANQIAAGEVVTRPANVVKELLENAIDAGAREIRVEIESGGTRSMRVIDDGCGIHPDDAQLALERHATSKIRELDDLMRVSTLGFRGEALPSIASVSRFTLRTRRAQDAEALELVVEGGSDPLIRPCALAPGTSVEVADLFFNVPARRKFLRAISTESAHVTECVRDVALAHPQLNVELIRDGRRGHRWLRMPSLEERVRDILSDYPLARAAGERGPLRMEAFLSGPERARNGARGLSLFVNRRPVRDRALARAVASAYGELLTPGRYPVGALYLDIPPELVDVNVHPQKAEVRFAEARAVTDAVHSILVGVIAACFGGPGATIRHEPAWSERRPASEQPSWRWSDSGSIEAPAPATTPATARSTPSPEPAATSLSLLAVVRERFLVCERADAVVIVDCRRARELDLSARAEAKRREGKPLRSQRLLFPIVRELPAAQLQRVIDGEAQLETLGFDLRPSGTNRVTLHAVPRLFSDADGELLLSDLLAWLDEPSDLPPLLRGLARRAAAAETISEEVVERALEAADANHDLIAACFDLTVLEGQGA